MDSNKKITVGSFGFKKQVSVRHLIIFALLFGIVGGCVIFRSFAASPVVATLEAERIPLIPGSSVINDSGASGGQAVKMTHAGTITSTINLPTDATSVVLTAKGERCRSKYPGAKLTIDGQTLFSKTIANSSWRNFEVADNLAPGNHSVSITYYDARSDGCRPLFLDLVTFYGSSAPSTIPTVTLNASPNSVTPGASSTLTWYSTNVSSCSASGAWSGSKSTSGSVSTGALNTSSTYNISCTGANGTASATATVSILASPQLGKRGTAQAMYNINNQVMNSANYVYGIRFVLDKDTPLYRFFVPINLEGVDGGIKCAGTTCRSGYGDGTGGIIDARLVTVNADGTPNLNNVLTQEKIGAVQRWNDTETAYGLSGANMLLYINTNNVMLKAGQMYVMTLRNVDPSPAINWFSTNSPTVRESAAGPNGYNNLDPNSPGAIDNLDPREALSWSTNGGSGWVWGRQVGTGNTSGAYTGAAGTDDDTRIPFYGWQASATSIPQSNQPYYAYKETGTFTVKIVNTTGTTLKFTQAGGYAPAGYSVGSVKITNLSTGATATTTSLGSGLTRGALSSPISVDLGQTYQLSNTGAVILEEADSFQRIIFHMDSTWPIQTVGRGPVRPALFAQ